MIDKELRDRVFEKITNGSFKLKQDMEEYFKVLKESYETEDEIWSKVKGVDKSYQAIIKDASFNIWVELNHDQVNYGIGTIPNPSVTVFISEQDFISLLTRKVRSAALYMEDRLNIQGDLKDLVYFRQLLRNFYQILLEKR
jgi:predicted lipid carrier protein YhbT